MNILVADATEHGSSLAAYLQTVGHEVVRVQTGQDALLQTRTMRPDAIIVDRSLAGLDGYSVVQRLRLDHYQWAAVMWSDVTSAGDVIAGLACGADDYVTYSTAYTEIAARIEACRRRLERGVEQGRSIVVGALTIDRDCMTVTIGGQSVPLTPKEYAIMLELALKPGAVRTRESLCRTICYWAVEEYGRAVDTHVSRLRWKMDDACPGARELIESVYGVGYRLVAKNLGVLEAA